MFTEVQDDGTGDDKWSYKTSKAPVKSSTTNKPIPSFLQAGCPYSHPISQNTGGEMQVLQTNQKPLLSSVCV